jgi:crotonobetainyl-CoA:carnitine CoA-transferase CaiB-like acyl-CoA transferase
MRVGEQRYPERARWGKPLDGVRILAIEQMQALPYCTQLLAHLGADVVKVEHPTQGESGRASRPAVIDEKGRAAGATFLRNNLGKRSIGIDLKRPEGVALLKRLVPHFDVVGENFKPGTLERLGLGYDVLAELNPRVILVSVSGFGNLEPSPYASWPAYAPIAEAMAGFYEQNRRGNEPLRPLVAGALGDIGTGMFAAIGALAALRHREQTGVGQHVDLSMYDAMVAMADMVPFLWSMGAKSAQAGGGSFGIIEGYAASDGQFVIEVIREHQFEALARAIGHPEWCGDPRFAQREQWDQYKESVFRPAIEAWARDKTKLEASHALCAAGVVAGPSNQPQDVCADPHVQMRNMVLEVPRPDSDKPFLVVGNPVKLSRAAEGPLRTWPRLAEHTDEVLRETLGLADAELDDLRRKGAIG